jgi:hypothetical protein
MVGDGLTCLTFGACTSQGTHFQKVGRIVEEVQDGWDGLTYLIRCMYQGTHLHQGGMGERQSRMVGDGLTCLTFGACTSQGTHLHQRWAG